MATPTQTTSARSADNVGSNPTIAAGLTFQAGRDVVIQLAHYTGSGPISGIAIGGTAGALIGRRQYGSTFLYAEEWLVKNIGSNSSNISVTVSGSGHYITLVGREFPSGTFGDIDTAAEGGAEGSGTTMAVSTGASIAQASSALFATYAPQTSANPYGLIDISGYSDVVLQQDNVNSQGIMAGWLEETATGVKTSTGSQTNNFPWAGSLGVVEINVGDSTAPVLSSPTGSATSSSTATVEATTDEGNGTMYAVVTTSSTQPSVAQIKAGQDHTGAAAVWSGSQAVSTTGAKTFSATGLSVATVHYAHLVHTDAAANDSNRVSSAEFTTYQRSAPTSDIAAGSWLPSSGADLHAMLSESTPDDANYVYIAGAPDPGNYFEVALSVLVDPATGANHLPAYRVMGDGVSGIEVTVRQGSTVIATYTHDPAPTGWTTYNQTLSGTEADSITDYTALRLRFTEV